MLVDRKLEQAFKFNRNNVNVSEKTPKAVHQENPESRKKLREDYEGIKVANQPLLDSAKVLRTPASNASMLKQLYFS